MNASPPPPMPPARVPSLGRRLVFGVLRLIPTILLWVVLPYAALTRLGSLGLQSSLNLSTIVIVGTVLAVLGSIRYIVKPTVAFGPVGAVGSAITAAYLFTLGQSAQFSFAGPSHVTLGLEYGTILELLAIVPLFGIAAALVTTAEDLVHPGERLPFDYPDR